MGEAIGGIAQGIGTVAAANASADAAKEQARIAQQTAQEQIAENARQFNITQPEKASEFAQGTELAKRGLDISGAAQTLQENTQAAREKAYAEAIARGGGQMTQGEQAFVGETNIANPELAQQEKDIASGNAKQLQQGTAQMNANLAMQGIRGGQAAGLLNRASGEQAVEAQKNINQMKFQDAATRAAELRAYQAAKAARGQSATLPAGAI